MSSVTTILNSDNRPADCNRRMRLPVLTLDVDGVFANFIQGLFDIAFERDLVLRSWRDLNDWSPVKAGMMTDEMFKACWQQAMETPYFWGNLELYEDMNCDLLNNYLDGGQCLAYFVTHRANLNTPKHVGDASFLTKCWLDNQGLITATGVIAGDHNRVELLRMLGSDFHLEDYPVEFERLRAAGLNAFLMDRPWNRHVDTPYRVFSLEEFLNATILAPRPV